MFFNGQNGQSMTTHISKKDLRIHVCSADIEDVAEFRESLKDYLDGDKELQRKHQQYQKKLQKEEEKFMRKYNRHVECLKTLHSKYGRKMADAMYNEFNHKIHIESDGNLYVITKDTSIDEDIVKEICITDKKEEFSNEIIIDNGIGL